jgi:hypothetical protein
MNRIFPFWTGLLNKINNGIHHFDMKKAPPGTAGADVRLSDRHCREVKDWYSKKQVA